MTTTAINTKLANTLDKVANGELQIVFTAPADAAAFESKAERDKCVRATFAHAHGVDATQARAQANRACVFWSCAAAFQRIEEDHTSTFLQDGNRTVTTGKALGDALKAARQQALADLQELHPDVTMKLADMPSTSGENYAWASNVAKLADEGSPAEILRMFQTEGVTKFLTERAEAFMRKPGGAIARAEAEAEEAARKEAEAAMAKEAEAARTKEAEAEAARKVQEAEAEAARKVQEAEAEAARKVKEAEEAAKAGEAGEAGETEAETDGETEGNAIDKARASAPANPNKPKHGKPDAMTRTSAAGAPSAAPSERPDNGDEKPFPNANVAKRELALVIGKALAAGVTLGDVIAMAKDQHKAQQRAANPDPAPQGKTKGKGGVSVAKGAKGASVNNLADLDQLLGPVAS